MVREINSDELYAKTIAEQAACYEMMLLTGSKQ